MVADGKITNSEVANVRIKSEGNEGTAGLEFTIKGTDEKGKQITETLKAVDADNAVSVNKFKTITEISTNKASSGKVTIGTTIKDTDYVFEVEEVQFKDGAGKFDIQVEAKDKDKDLKVDEAAFGGYMLGDTFLFQIQALNFLNGFKMLENLWRIYLLLIISLKVVRVRIL